LFRCDVCDCVVAPNTSPITIAETRAITHPRRSKIYWHPPKDGEKGKWVDDPGGPGTQIVRELRACASCAATR